MLKNRVIYCHAGDLAMLLSLAETSLGHPFDEQFKEAEMLIGSLLSEKQ